MKGKGERKNPVYNCDFHCLNKKLVKRTFIKQKTCNTNILKGFYIR